MAIRSACLPPQPCLLHPPTFHRSREKLRELEREDAYDRVASGLPGDRRVWIVKMPQIEEYVKSNEEHRMHHSRPQKHHKPGQRLGHDELSTHNSCQKPNNSLGKAANPD